jgi:hypothetical protein
MTFQPLQDGRPEIDYPCSWEYRLIGYNEDLMRRAISDVLGERGCLVSFSKQSRRGRYLSLSVELQVPDEQTRTGLFHAFKQHPDVLYVL